MTYLLDTNIVSYFLQAGAEGDLARAARICPMALVEEVRVELENDPQRGSKAFQRWFSTSTIDVRKIDVGSDESATLAELTNPSSSTRDLGERASIAVAAYDPSLVFVAHDKAGLWLALRELHAAESRIIGVFVFLRRLWEAKAIVDPQIIDDVRATLPSTPQPTWWPAWRTGLAPQSPAGSVGSAVMTGASG